MPRPPTISKAKEAKVAEASSLSSSTTQRQDASATFGKDAHPIIEELNEVFVA
jgi:hypothetical protein